MPTITIKSIAVAAVFTWAGGTFHAAIAAESVKASVNGMVCAFCAQGIEKRLSALPATQAVYVDLKRKIVAVEAKPGQKLDGKAITFEITEAGYDVTKLETLAKSVADIKLEANADKKAKP
jgi:cation transport ATPase